MNDKHYYFLRSVILTGFNNMSHKDQLTKWSEEPDMSHEMTLDVMNHLIAWTPIKENNTILYLTEKYFYEVIKHTFWVRMYRKPRIKLNDRFAEVVGVSFHEGKFKLGRDFLKDCLDIKISL